MILFVLEGKNPDLNLYKAMMRICGADEESVAVVYGCNIDALYQEMKDLGEGADIVGLLKEKYSNNPSSDSFKWTTRSDQISEVYLIFDYDFHDFNRSPDILNAQLRNLLDYFSEETDHGKLYINYPMIEAIKHTKKLPDPEYYSYSVCREDCRNYKHLAAEFSYYPNMDFLTRGEESELKDNWNNLKFQNVSKANYICNENNSYPPIDRESICQIRILEKQIQKFESQQGCKVSILSSFPLLMYDWLGY